SAAKMGRIQRSNDTSLIDDNIRLPHDSPEHQGHRDSRYGERNRQMRFAYWVQQVTQRSNHLFLLAVARMPIRCADYPCLYLTLFKLARRGPRDWESH